MIRVKDGTRSTASFLISSSPAMTLAGVATHAATDARGHSAMHGGEERPVA
jgi:hypothetical protein